MCQKKYYFTYNKTGDTMNNIDNFKRFVKSNPHFATYIKDGSMTWQKFYELYDMYGENSKVWDEFKIVKKNSMNLLFLQRI